ncbi:cryptochrome/photolyase family protein [Calothrix sp. NIES-3974]|uniref:cryptochrome/photolyase family protein n=1 Tax=Calothrix sp. NIES-3974 TaxID=2005462 RepID=UPI000B617436|nr:cryptochrome/photolyase family protein [Calothrix sp. NIES-3974]BAZ04344.1 deoxyribodipyrimidine photolyase-related protein [Calothrix sp. NIES-3974]
MTVGIWILGDQLSQKQAALTSCHPEKVPVILIESLEHIRTRPYHRQKLVLIWSAMRHFAEELRQQGYPVTYEVAAADFQKPLIAWLKANHITELRVMQPADRPFRQFIMAMQSQLPCSIQIIPNNHFLWSTSDFQKWANGKKSLLLESFYREGRKRLQILMVDNQPVGGEWNYDKQNRQPPPRNLITPQPKVFPADEITQAVIHQVKSLDIPTFGEINNFNWAVTRNQALAVLADFIDGKLAQFGPYQDAMVTGENTMWHSLISPYLNIGLLHPLEVIQAAETAYYQQQIPLNSVEGFIRQILGWREYMYGLYNYVDSDYPQQNYFQHHQPLPEFFWTGKTKMNCLHQVLKQTINTGYAHHIQRLMVLSNFALIAGISPQAVENWFHAAFIDAYDWVMQTNVIGMGLFADGGILASKPYAASANYIHNMSDYCRNCSYDRKSRTGSQACPFNYFYWDFLDRHRDKLTKQGRMSFILKNLDKMPETELAEIRDRAQKWHE